MPASALACSDSSSAHNVITRVFDSAGFQSRISPRKPELSRSQGRSWSRTISRPRSCCSWVVWRAWRRASTLSFYTVAMPFVPRLVIAWAINLAALWVADAIWDGVRIDGWTGLPDRLRRPGDRKCGAEADTHHPDAPLDHHHARLLLSPDQHRDGRAGGVDRAELLHRRLLDVRRRRRSSCGRSTGSATRCSATSSATSGRA